MARTSAVILFVLLAAAGCSEQKPAASPPNIVPVTPMAAQTEPSASPARNSGLPDFSVLVQKQGPIERANELPRLVAASKPGTTAALQIWRQGASRNLNVTLGEFPAEAVIASSVATTQSPNRLGLAVSELPSVQGKALGVKFGIVVEAVQGPAQKAQVRRGDVITAVNNTDLTSIQQFNDIIAQQKPGDSVALLVRRGPASVYIPVEVGAG